MDYKKMLAVSAALIGTAAMAVESSVVGYQNVDVPAGYSMRAATFKAISGDYKISDIGVEGAGGVGNEYGQLVNTDGTWGNVYYFLTEDEMFVPTGWYKDMLGDEPVTDEDVLEPAGSMFFAADSDLTVTFPAVL